MLQRYRVVFRAPGSAAFCAAGFVVRMPIAIYPIAIVLVISARTGHYGFAGVLSACYTLGGCIGMPALSVLVDRYGQRRLIVPAAVVHAAAAVTLAVLVRTSASDAVLTVPALVLGFSYLSVGSLVRARWNHVLAGRPELGTALSMESVLDELIFVLGPLIATLIATHATPVLALYTALALVVGGSGWLAGLRATEPPVHDRQRDAGPALRAPGMLVLTLVTVPMGAVFAAAEISAVAFCGQHGHRALSGFALATLAGGSALAGVLYGARTRPADVLDRFRRQALLFAALPFVLLAAANVPLLIACMFVLGTGIAPTLITAFGLVQRIVPQGALTEGLSWISTGLGVGYGAGAALVGGIADRHGARSGFLLVIAAALVAGALALVLHRRLSVPGPEQPDTQAVGAVGTRSPGSGWDTR